MQRLSQVTAQKVEEALRSMNYETWNQYRCVNNTVCDTYKHFIPKSGMDQSGHNFWPLTTNVTNTNWISSCWSLSAQLCPRSKSSSNCVLTRMDNNNNTAQKHSKNQQIHSNVYHREGEPAGEKGRSKTHDTLTLVSIKSSPSLTPGYFYRTHQPAPAQRQFRLFRRKEEVLGRKIPSIFITAVMESIKPSNQSLVATSVLFAALQAFEWLHFHSTQVPWSTFSIFYPLYMLMLIMAGLVLFFLSNSLSEWSHRLSLRAGQIAAGHRGLAPSFNSSGFDYFCEDYSWAPITWRSPIKAFSESRRRRRHQSAPGRPASLSALLET